MRWRKESTKAKSSHDFVDNRFKIYASKPPITITKQERLEDFLRRGGTIKYINKIAKKGAQTIMNKKTEVQQQIDKKLDTMTAIEAATMAKQDQACSIEQIMQVIPQYKAALPRRSWIAKFLKLIDPQDTRFIDLK